MKPVSLQENSDGDLQVIRRHQTVAATSQHSTVPSTPNLVREQMKQYVVKFAEILTCGSLDQDRLHRMGSLACYQVII